MRVLDLFAGIGGFSLAAHWMGWETAAFVEKDKFCQRVLRKNFGDDIEIHDDITTFDGRPFRGAVDIVTGGFPCQPFSAAGKRKGRDDDRHLFPAMLRVVAAVRPRWVVAENVRGLLSIESGRVFAEVVASLEGQGFEVVTFCIPASAVEAPHRRDRLWIIASNTDGQRERAGHREVRCPNGKVSERHDDAELSNADRVTIADADGRPSGTSGAAKGKAESANESVCRGLDFAGCDDSNASHSRATRRLGVETDDARPGRCGRDQCRGGERFDGRGDGSNALLDGSQRLRDERHGSRPTGLHSRENTVWREHWLEAAARFCRVDDGVSDRVHRLKALGNSIVPQIAFEIFKAIEATDMEPEPRADNDRW